MFGWKAKAGAVHRGMADRSGAYGGGLALQTEGLMAGTRVASNLGWRAVEALAAGDMVLTFDNDMQEIIEIRRLHMWLDAPESATASWPVIVPEGALGNRAPLTLLADQGVMVESDAACDMLGDPFVVLPAHALDGVRGIHRAAPMNRVELIVLVFAEEQVIYVEGGALLHCSGVTSPLDGYLAGETATYDVLGPQDAAVLAEWLVMEDEMRATGGQAQGRMATAC